MRGPHYVLMTYARSGATWLAQLLGSTGALGRPEDWFNGQGYRNRGVADYPLDRPGQLERAMVEGRSENGVIGLKLSVNRMDALKGFDWASRFAPTHFIHLTRRDALARAISEVRAEQTGQWRSTTEPRGQLRYDPDAIRKALIRQVRDEARLRLYFARNRIVPLEISYEDLAADPDDAVLHIADFLEVPFTARADHRKVTLTIQRDPTNTEWRDRFTRETFDLRVVPPLGRAGVLARLGL